ncbi:hypothetical protein CF70_018525 [Cupriavidus sp. SK-3]|nr:hypothetical protein CF70_018525 [Cupriavidus sp. SK-3]
MMWAGRLAARLVAKALSGERLWLGSRLLKIRLLVARQLRHRRLSGGGHLSCRDWMKQILWLGACGTSPAARRSIQPCARIDSIGGLLPG